MQKKLILTFLIIAFTFIVLNINTVFGYGLISQAWTNDIDGNKVLLFRTYTGASDKTIKNYDKEPSGGAVEGGWKYIDSNGKTRNSKWVYRDPGEPVESGIPGTGQYNTIALIFHKDQLTTYTDSDKGKYGYHSVNTQISFDLNTINNAHNNSKRVRTDLSAVVSKPSEYKSKIFYSVQSNTGTYSSFVDSNNKQIGTGMKVLNRAAGAGTEYRYALVDIASKNIYVSDSIIRSADLAKLVRAAKDNDCEKDCKVSKVLISEADSEVQGNPTRYEVSVSAYDFTKQYKKGWGNGTLGVGVDEKSMGSFINLFDNTIKFPQLGKRTVLVRHINIGNNTTISTNKINNATRINVKNLTDDLYLTTNNLKDNTEYSEIASTTTSNSYTTTYEEYYESRLDIEQYVKKSALPDTDTYKCIGYNVGIGLSESAALEVVEGNIRNSKVTLGTSLKVDGKSSSSDNDYIVIDFYYSEYDKNVTANHIYVNINDGKPLAIAEQTIKPNNQATMDGVTISKVNSDVTVREEYKRKLGKTVTVAKAQSFAPTDTIKYLGCKISTENKSITDILKDNVLDEIRNNEFDNSITTANLADENIQANFYYSVNPEKIVPEPQKTIEGQLFITPIDANKKGNCKDNDSQFDNADNKTVTTIPSGSEVKVGILGIPRYMVGAIQSEKVYSGESQTGFKLNVSMGKDSLSVNFKDNDSIKYNVGYYKLTDMVVYKLNKAEAYDAEYGNNGSGSSLFSWSTKELKPTEKNLVFKRTGILNTLITNTNVDNINSYLRMYVKYNNPLTGKEQSERLYHNYDNTEMKIELISKDVFDKMDLNHDNIIDKADIQKGYNSLKSAENVLETLISKKESIEASIAQETSIRAQLKLDLDTAKANKDRLYSEYQKASEKLLELESKTAKLEKDLQENKEKLEKLKDELKRLEQIETQRYEDAQKATQERDKAIAYKDNLWTIYQQSATKRNELEAAAQCNDSVEEEVYIYLEQHEKDALEACRQAKIALQKHIEEQVVENALNNYTTYYNDVYLVSESALTEANNNYSDAQADVANKESEILTLNLTIFTLETLTIPESEKIASEYKANVWFVAQQASLAADAAWEKADEAYKKNLAEKALEEKRDELEAIEKQIEQAQKEKEESQAAYDFVNNNYDKYKAQYDLFQKLKGKSSRQIAKELGLQVNIKVQNMLVAVGESDEKMASIYNSGDVTSNTAEINESLKTYLDSGLHFTETSTPIINKEVYSSIGSTALTEKDYTQTDYISKEILNGRRVLSGKAEYVAEVKIGSKDVDSVKDTVYHSDEQGKETKVFYINNTNITREYKMNASAKEYDDKYKNVKPVNVYTPITVSADLKSDTDLIVDQTINKPSEEASQINSPAAIQINTPFTITLGNETNSSTYTRLNGTTEFRNGYYIKFEFDVHKVKINGKTYKNGNRIPAGTWIGIINAPADLDENATVVAQAYGNLDEDTIDIVTEESSGYTVRAVSYNATDTMKTTSLRYKTLHEMMSSTSNLKDIFDNICKGANDYKYFAEKNYEVVIINRLYDFKVTDVKDVNWKNIFRTSTTNSTNTHTGTVYYAGTTKWDTSSERTNNIITRSTAELGRNPLRILPIGPYKNTDATYVKAPKLGYRFSFDLKITGSYYTTNNKGELTPNVNKSINIGTRFYYISKDGKTHYKEYTGGGTKGIYLFYKTSDGKYVRIDNAGGGYDLRFTPNDGYRYIEDSDISNLATKSISLGSLRNLKLTYQMATPSNNRASTTYYGEYKLPNSTIAVLVDENGNYDINKPLTNGYIGVIFDITAQNNGLVLSYSENTKDGKFNVSQWDYEGYLGHTKKESQVTEPISIKLEKGVWEIKDEMYNNIKGSIILYDIDERAATDYE